ncbi:MAG TPA: hypothetical protein VLX58_12110 [Bryobacteraceae bacterium]|nr:hypothetical protein [Bryobacteraceae bacterium]
MDNDFRYIELRVPAKRFESWDDFIATAPEYSIGLEVIDDTPGHRGHYVHFDHHTGVIREATMSAAMQAYIAVRQGHLMQKWLRHRCPIPVYVWNADQDVCLAAFILEYHELLERFHADPLLRWIVQFNNKIDVCGGLYPVDLDEVVRNHFTWVLEPFRQQRMQGKMQEDEALVKNTIRQVCNRLEDLLQGRAGIAPITAEPSILYTSPHGFVIADEKGDPNSRLVLAAQGHTNLISLVCARKNGRYTYSVIRGSPYDEDTFQVTKLIEAFQAAEDFPNLKIWGGSNLAAGSDSELGSSLHWTRLRDIAEPIVQEASRAPAFETRNPGRSRFRVLLVMAPEEAAKLQPVLEECGAQVSVVSSCAEASQAIRSGVPIRAIFSARRLPDGGVRDCLEMAKGCPHYLPLILCLPKIDGGWIDLLELGAFSLIVEPYRQDEVRRAIEAVEHYGTMHLAETR